MRLAIAAAIVVASLVTVPIVTSVLAPGTTPPDHRDPTGGAKIRFHTTDGRFHAVSVRDVLNVTTAYTGAPSSLMTTTNGFSFHVAEEWFHLLRRLFLLHWKIVF